MKLRIKQLWSVLLSLALLLSLCPVALAAVTLADAETPLANLGVLENQYKHAGIAVGLDAFNDAIANCATQASADLATAKTNAKATVDAVNATDYVTADQEIVADAKTTAVEAIEAATTEAEVATALTNFNTAIAGCTTQAAAVLAKTKTNANGTVNAVNATDYVTADQETVANAKSTAVEVIEAATTVAEVETALTNFNNAIAGCTTQTAADLAAAKTNATNTVNSVNANDYITDDREIVADAKATTIEAIEAATTEVEVATALTNFNTAIAGCTTQAVAALAAAKTSATETVNA